MSNKLSLTMLTESKQIKLPSSLMNINLKWTPSHCMENTKKIRNLYRKIVFLLVWIVITVAGPQHIWLTKVRLINNKQLEIHFKTSHQEIKIQQSINLMLDLAHKKTIKGVDLWNNNRLTIRLKCHYSRKKGNKALSSIVPMKIILSLSNVKSRKLLEVMGLQQKDCFNKLSNRHKKSKSKIKKIFLKIKEV